MLHNVFLVALGGAVGTTLRYLTGVGIARVLGVTGFPLAIITVNVIGSFLMGVFVVFAMERGLAHYYSPLVMTGLLGGFTTYSAFSLETVTLIEHGHPGLAAVYVVLSVVLCIGALMLGIWVMRKAFV
ncbi:MAG: fluoride efflux transporter CrcB [Rhodobacteraceae bacterium]|nr:fluoride efflux transporter CrcB [Paracoccaceae bacterium]